MSGDGNSLQAPGERRPVTYRAGRYATAAEAEAGETVIYEERTLEPPFWHGGRGRVPAGGQLTAGRRTNSWGDEPGRSKNVYFATDIETAALTAKACRKEHGRGYLYEVQPDADQVEYWHDGYRTPQPLTVLRVLDLDAALRHELPEQQPEAEAEAGLPP